jgi:hypothetical protein
MSCDKTARIIIKLGQGLPTIPVSTDHRNGDWIATDIYEGEQYMDTNTGLVYTRNGSTIVPSSIANFANADLTFTGNRAHDTDGNSFELTTDNGVYGESYLYMDSNESYLGTDEAYFYSDGQESVMYANRFPVAVAQDNQTFLTNYGRQKAITSISSLTTLTETNHVVNCTANSFTIELPPVAGIVGQEYIIKNSGSGTITIDPDGAETIDGAASISLGQFDSVTIISTGTNWIII